MPRPSAPPRNHLAAMIAGLLLFVALAASIQPGSPLDQLDSALTASVRELASERLLQFAHLATRAGDTLTITLLGIAIAAALAVRRRWTAAGIWALTLAGGALVHRGLKEVFTRVRPPHDHGLIVESGWSFPSNHASMSMIAYGMLAWLLLHYLRGRGRLPILLATALLVLAIGASRVLLQVHFVTDVLAGYASGGAWLAAGIACMRAAMQKHRDSADGT
ncbi:MAG: phosphatase PAP2 family protein [Burkholderiaceae bacterium]